MTVSTTTSKVSYSGNGSTTAFAVGFYFLANSHLRVVLRAADGTETVRTLGTDYTVTGAGVPSGGTVTMATAPASGVTIVIARNVPQTQLVDYQPNDPFPASTHEQALDQLTMEVQQLQEQITRALKLSLTNTMTSTEFTVGASSRVNKVLGFDAAGELSVTQELGTYRGNWGSGVAYQQRDIIKDTSTNNIWICLTAHTSSGAQPISTNTDAAKWALLVDAAAAATSASNAATSASAAATSATNAATSATNASNSASTASTQASNASTSATNAASSASAASSSASSASTSATNAGNSATAASNSAAAAAAAVASGLYSTVIDKSANYTVVAGDAGDLIRVSTGSGAVTITLPQISTVSDGYKVAIVKWTGDTNAVTVQRSGSDTINGATTALISSQYTQITFVADFETSQWFAATSGLGSTNVLVDVFNGNNSTVAFTLSGSPGTKNNTYVYVGGVYQQKSTYSLSGTTLTFTQAPPSGTGNIEVVWTQPLAVGVPSDGTISTAKVQDNAITYPKLSADVQGAIYGFKNRIINGAMVIDQRNAGASISVTATGFPVDRFYINANSFGVISGQRSTTAPTGFTNSTLMAVTTARSSIAAADVYGIRQTIEGFNTADLGWGTASAQAVTLSFWVRSSITGTYTAAFFNTAFNRSYVATYTINAANTFEQKTITLAGDTTGTWATDNTGGINVYFDLGSGSDFQTTANAWTGSGKLRTSGSSNWISTNGATFYITGVQLEKGSTATSFDYRDYGRELMMCQRYYEKSFSQATAPAIAAGLAGAITAEQFATGHNFLRFRCVQFAVEKRAAPTITFYNPNTSSTTPAGLQGGDEGGVTTLNVGVTDRSNYRSTRSFFPLLNGTVQGTNSQFNVYATQWTAEIEL